MGRHLTNRDTRILLLEGVDAVVVGRFAEAGYTQIKYLEKSLSEPELAAALEGVHVVGIRSRTQLNAKVLRAAGALVAVGCFCAGTNQVDLAAATSLGIPVFNAPFENTRSVAELVLAETILLLRRIPERSAAARRGQWQKSAGLSFEARGKTLGIVGYGNVGSQLSVLAEAIGMRVLFHDIVRRLPNGNARQVASLDALLEESDVVSLHVPETPETWGMIGARELELLGSHGCLINASRGTVVDIGDLVTALVTGRLSGAAIDVFPEEPKASGEAFDSPLRKFDNVLLTPHIGGSTVEAQYQIGQRVVEGLLGYLESGLTRSSVNFSELGPAAGTNGAMPFARDRDGRTVMLRINRDAPGRARRIEFPAIGARPPHGRDDQGPPSNDHIVENALASAS